MNKKYKNPGGWFSFFFFVLTVGVILALFNIGFGGGASIRIPFTDQNLSIAGSIGKKEVVQNALPNYMRDEVATNNSFFNNTTTLTIWIAEGMGLLSISYQPEAPAIDLNFNLIR